MASLDRSTIEAARNLGASRLRILVEIVVPQVRQTVLVGLILSFVIMMSVLSVPLMINAQSPTMITANMAFRINAYGDYGVANALGLISYLMTGAVSWIYLRYAVREQRGAHERRAPRGRWLRWIVRGIVLALLAFASSARSPTCCCGPSPSAGTFPHKLPLEYGFSFWGRVFAPRGGAIESLTNSIVIAARHGGAVARDGDSRGLRARAAETARPQPDPARVPAAAGVSRTCPSTSTSPASSTSSG